MSMTYVIAPFRLLDALIQRGINAAVIFLMRRGVPRSLIFYTLGITTALAFLGDSFSSGSLIAGAIGAAVTLALTQWALLHDQAAEHRGVMSSVDYRRQLESPLWKVFFVILGVWDVVTELNQTAVAFSTVFWVSLLVDLYVANSPRRPPPKKQAQETPDLQPAQVTT